MSKIRVAINGFGRIGRITFRYLLENNNVEVVAVNDLTNPKTLAHLLKYDSNHGRFDGEVSYGEDNFLVNGQQISLFSEREPEKLPWEQLKVDIVVECTGAFRTKETAGKHIKAGAKKVILSAPASDDMKTVVIGVNEGSLSNSDTIISNASCTTNCLAPIVKILDERFGLKKGYINTVHAYTADQNLQDAPHKDLRRARAAASSIIPTSTGAAKAVALVLPHLKNKLDGIALRVPVPAGSVTDFTAILEREVTAEEINEAVKAAAGGAMKGILEYTTDPIVSVDIVGNRHSCIFDSSMTAANGEFVKVLAWYDNEAGYAARTADLVEIMSAIR